MIVSSDSDRGYNTAAQAPLPTLPPHTEPSVYKIVSGKYYNVITPTLIKRDVKPQLSHSIVTMLL